MIALKTAFLMFQVILMILSVDMSNVAGVQIDSNNKIPEGIC